MAERAKTGDLTVYLEGHEGHQGNVLLRAFYKKLHRLELVLNKLERAYLNASTRRSDFEIINAAKSNPTSVTLRIVPHVINYNPRPALEWGVEQMATVGRGDAPDGRLTADIADDLVELSTKDAEVDYRAFWIFLAVAGAVWYFVSWAWALVPAFFAAFSAFQSVSASLIAARLDKAEAGS